MICYCAFCHMLIIALADRSPCFDQFIVGPPLGHEITMSALLNDGSIGHHRYDVGIPDRRQPVSDGDAGPSFSRLIQSRLDDLKREQGCCSEPRFTLMFLGGVWECVTCSLSVSRAEVASSSSRILGFLTMARAMAMRCFCPLDIWEPCAPTWVSYFLQCIERRRGRKRSQRKKCCKSALFQRVGFMDIYWNIFC